MATETTLLVPVKKGQPHPHADALLRGHRVVKLGGGVVGGVAVEQAVLHPLDGGIPEVVVGDVLVVLPVDDLFEPQQRAQAAV